MKQKLLFLVVALLLLTGNLVAKKIAFIDQSTNFGVNSQSGIVTALTTAGYQVTTFDLINTTLGALDFTALGTYDLVVISKACNSGMFLDATVVANWAALKVPYIALTPYIIRSNRLNLINSAGYTVSADKTDLTSITKAVPVMDDPTLVGVTTGLDPFDYFKGYFETITTTATTMNGSAGTVIVNLNSDAVKGAGMPLMIRWSAGVAYTTAAPTTTGVTSGANNAAARTYLGIGSDNTTADQNYNNFTEQSLKLFMNEVQRYAPLASGVNEIKESRLVSINGHQIQFLNNVNSVEVFNSTGSMIKTQCKVLACTKIDLNRAGIYVVKVKSELGVEVQKLIVP
jgi:hypothetical protein